MSEFSVKDRKGLLTRLGSEEFDLVVIGGGITGAGILRDATYRGLKAALVEMRDFASGTSSKSSKLIHGGLRYLKSFDIGLVFESVNERTRLLRLARHVVKPLPFIFPVYKNDPDGLFKIKLGLWVYDMLCAFRNYRNHKGLSREKIAELMPGIQTEGLKGGALYYDAITDDARITVEVVMDAYKHGAVPLNYAKALKVITKDSKVTGLKVKDLITGEEIEVSTKFVVVAAGPWNNRVLQSLGVDTPLKQQLRLRPTKGTHVVVQRDRLPVDHALVMISPIDQRVMFVIPWHNATVIGTTDTDFEGDPATVVATIDDVDYILKTANHYFPEAGLTHDDVIATWSGLRPLIDEGEGRPSEISRTHKIAVDLSGIAAIGGGKLTTFRVMAKDMVDKILPYLGRSDVRKSPLKHVPLPYAHGAVPKEELDDAAHQFSKNNGIPVESAKHLLTTYGGFASEVLKDKTPDLLEPVVDGLPYLLIEAKYAVTHEMATKLEDFFLRRTPIFLLTDRRSLEDAFLNVARVMGSVLDWSQDRITQEVSEIKGLLERNNSWRQNG